jgi:hypothetical protein
MPTQTDIDIILQQNQKYSIRLDVYDASNTKTGELTGDMKTLSGSISSDSDIRRTANLVMHVPDKSFLSQNHLVAWMTKKIKVYIGLDDTSGTTHWYLFGTMLVSNTSSTFDSVTQDLTMPLIDMMACTTEQRGSKINGYGLKILAGANVRSSLISIIESFTPFHQYNIPEFTDTIPYDLEFGIGIYPYEALKTILGLWPEYEMYYDPDGVFTVAKIPTLIDDEVFLDSDVINALLIKEDRSSSFSPVKNTTEIIGKSLDADYTASTCTTSGGIYNLFIGDTFEVLEDGALYGFTPDETSIYGQKIKIQDAQAYEIFLQGSNYDNDVFIDTAAMTSGVPYCVKYTANRFYLQGELEIHAIVQEVNAALTDEEKTAFKTAYDCRDVYWVVNPDSPFAADAIGTLVDVKNDGEYADIYTTQLAIERGVYENWKSTRLQNEIQLTLGLIPWLDVNKKIQYRSPMLTERLTASLSMDEDGNVLLSDSTLPPYEFYTEDNVVYVDETEFTGNYNGIDFSINDEGELIATSDDNISTLIIKSINFDFSNIQSPMTVNAVDFYPYYPFVEKLYIENDGLYSSFQNDNESLSFDIIDGGLYYDTAENFEESPYANFNFSISENGSLIYM